MTLSNITKRQNYPELILTEFEIIFICAQTICLLAYKGTGANVSVCF